MASVRVAAPAKINLGLRVLGRRADGYHELESLFLPLDLADALVLEVAPARRAAVDLAVTGAPGPEVPADARNLAFRAAEGFLAAAGLAREVRIELHKRVPAAAGLGGGSSDAGAVLRGLAESHPGALDPAALAALALRLGADVPFFLDPRPAWVRGVGEVVEAAPGLPPLALLLVNPGAAVATAEVYRAFDALRPSWTPRPAPALPDLRYPGGDPEALQRLVENDLEPAAVRLCPAIGRLRAALRDLGAVAVGLSGSGATLFGVFEDAAAARAAASRARIPEPGWLRLAATRESG